MLVAIFVAKRFEVNVYLITSHAYISLFQCCFGLGCSLVFLGSLMRTIATFPFYEFVIPHEKKFSIAVAGQAVVSAGHPFILIICTHSLR